MVNQNTFILFLFLITYSLSAQTGDCVGAHIIDTKETFEFDIEPNGNLLSDFLPSCTGGSNELNEDGVFNVYWIGWEIKTSGTIVFELSKDSDDYDIDFILYKSNNSSSPCSDLQPIRCMFSGETAGQPSEPCLYETGLSFDEVDLYEDPGCNDMSNNFLRYVDAVQGEHYRLISINFADQNPSKIKFCGTALFGDNDQVCTDINSTENIINEPIIAFPNPAYDLLSLNNIDSWSSNATIEVIDIWGNTVLTTKPNLTANSLDISGFTPGLYYVRVLDGKLSDITSFIKI